MPAGPRGKAYTFVGGSNLMMFKSSKNKDAAWEVMKFMSPDDIQTKYAELLGMFPSRTEPQQAIETSAELRVLVQGDPAGPDLRADPAVGPDRERLQGAFRQHPRCGRRAGRRAQRRHEKELDAAAKEADALLAQSAGG